MSLLGNMHLREEKERIFCTFPYFEKIPFLLHGCSTRFGGISEGVYQSLNLGLKTYDDHQRVLTNIKIFAQAIGAEANRLVLSDQTHTNHIRVVGKEDAGKGFCKAPDYHDIDGMITAETNLPLLIFAADCVPILFVDPVKRVIGAAHAGWRGTRLQIAAKMVQAMQKEFACQPQNIVAGIGPCIGSCCYEVGEELYQEFEPLFYLQQEKQFFCQTKENKYHLDLVAVNEAILQNAGLQKEHIVNAGLCTCCHKDIFFSHRGHHGRRGLCGSLIQLQEI